MSINAISCIISVILVLQPVFTVAQGNEVLNKSQNDTILEFFNNCTCIPFYLCGEANKYVEAARSNVLPKDFFCSNSQFFCCTNNNITNSTTTTTTTTTPKTITTTEQPTVRHISLGGVNCGIAKTRLNVRLLNPDDDSATTIPGEIPWIVEIFQKKKSNRPYTFKCPGTLIHPKVVLTSTHCVVSSKAEHLKIVATGLENFQNLDVKQSDERTVQKIIKHPKYYSGGLYNDIALLILDSDYDFSDNYLNSICIPSTNTSFDGKKCIAAGWGRNIVPNKVHPLNKVDVPVVNFEECQNLLRSTSLGKEFALHSSFMCAGGEKDKDTCNGDGGGPLMCIGDNYEFVQVGIVSWGVNNECGVENQPGLYTNVAEFSDWINEELKANKLTLNVKD